MSDTPSPNGSPNAQRYRLPGIEREGIAQLSLLETALWPLQGGTLPDAMFETTYGFVTPDGKREAHVRVFSPKGMQSIDEYILWGLLGVSLSRPEGESTLLATPYWILKQLGMTTGGFEYDQLRASLERLALVAYQNSGFFNPVSQQHERATFHFFSSYLPTKGGGGLVDSERAWRIEWDQHFFKMCQATGGTLLFDLDLYRDLSPASRRLFLKLKDRFWRSNRVFMNVDDLTINGLGFSAVRPLFKRKYDLTSCIRELLEHQVIELSRGQTDPHDLFLKRSKGCYVVQFFEGAYFRQAASQRAQRQKNAITTDPLYEPLKQIGIDERGIRRIMSKHSRRQIQKWIKITDAAMHEKPVGFPGFKASPAAFFIDAIGNNRMPPDWIYAHEKKQHQQQWERERSGYQSTQQPLQDQWAAEREAATKAYLQSTDGRRHWEAAYAPFLEFYKKVEPHRAEAAAREAATTKVSKEYVSFPTFGEWLLNRPAATN